MNNPTTLPDQPWTTEQFVEFFHVHVETIWLWIE